MLIFLDADVEIPEELKGIFLSKVVEELGNFDVMELKKVVCPDSFFSSLVYYDYFSESVANYFLYKKLKRCVGINGAGFAVRRFIVEKIGGFKNFIVEDMEFGLDLFKKELQIL